MAHTDSCKIQVCQFVEKLTANGVSINQACKDTEKESDGIPADTIRRWWYEIKKDTEELFKNEQPDQPPPTPSNDTEITNNQSPFDEIKAPRSHRPTGEPKGGLREGAGRKAKYISRPITADDKVNIKTLYPMTSNFGKAYDNMIYAIKGEKEKDWAEMSQNSILWHIETLILLAKGESLCGM